MLRRSLILLIEIGVIFIILMSIGLFWASYYVDTDAFRQRFSDAVEQIVGTPVVLDGELNIALYPALSLEVLGLSIQGEEEFSDTSLVTFDTLQVSVRLVPLLSNRIDIRSILVDGMKINIAQSSEKKLNWEPLMHRFANIVARTQSGISQAPEFYLSELDVTNATIAYDDAVEDQAFSLSGINLRTGAIAPGRAVPFSASSHFAWKGGGIQSEITLKGMIESSDDGRIKLNNSTIYASVGGAFLPSGANPGEMTAQVVMDWEEKTIALDGLRVRFLGLLGEGNLKSTDFIKDLKATGHFAVRPFKPSDVVLRYFPKAPIASVEGLSKGVFASDFHIGGDGFSLKNLVATLDDMTVKGAISMKGYRHSDFYFNLQSSIVDLDRYLPLFKTDTPFIWDDFKLPLFRAFRGNGEIKADGFKILDTSVLDVRLSAVADNEAVRVEAKAINNDGGELAAEARFTIGENPTTQAPTFAMQGQVTAHFQKSDFALLDFESFGATGIDKGTVQLSVSSVDCPPQERSIEILRHLSGDFALALSAGEGWYTRDKTKDSFAYSKADCSLKISPLPADKADTYGFDTALSARGHGGEKVRTFSLIASGPLALAIEDESVMSQGIHVKANVGGPLYTDQSSRLNASGKVAFDSASGQVSITDAMVRTLETNINGNAKIVGLNTYFKVSGNVAIPGANLRRVIYLLTKIALRTEDTEALKNARLETNFTADKSGFTLSGLEGSLDGMAFSGHVVGQGFTHPKCVFSLSGGVLDIDRYIPPSSKPTVEELRAGKEHKAPPVDLPLGFLRWLRINGKARFEEFKLADVRAKSLSGNIRAEDGAINISDVKGKVHDGNLQAGWVGEVSDKSLTTHLKLHIEDMQAGPLMVDMAEREYVRGETDVDIDLKSSGVTDDDIIKNLDGKTWVRIRNGSFKFSGYNTSPSSRSLNAPTSLTGSPDPKLRRTVFQKAMAYFTVKKGVFTVDKFRVESPPVLQSYGQGSFSLPDNTVDMSVRNDFVAVPSVTINVVGKLSDPEVEVPKGKILDGTVRNILSLPEKSFEFLRDLFQ
ncbi:AsmA family protein [Pseudodesulfovibrio sp.]|nr:AsmA family protein [Pseudodesulfovibrio sp.]